VVTKHEMNDLGNNMSSGEFYLHLSGKTLLPRLLARASPTLTCAPEWRKSWDGEYYAAYTGILRRRSGYASFYKATGCEDYMTWEEFQEKKIFCGSLQGAGRARGASCRPARLLAGPGGKPPVHTNGEAGILLHGNRKIHARRSGRPPVPHWIREWGESHDERLSSDRAEKKYPLLCMSNHGRWRMHAQCDDIIWNREVETMKIPRKGRLPV
jgi:trimethylamine-N-oxide reductase (cytochrome c)